MDRIMNKWKEEFAYFYRDKVYRIMLCLTAICAYGFQVTHFTIGIDDTPYAYYFEEGLAAIVGRWVLFVLNKMLNISEFAPFLTDFVAVLLLMIAVTVWGMLFHQILGDKVPKYGYFFGACICLSCPLISEVFTYYLHNGIAIGYLSCGISLCCFREGLLQWNVWKEMRNKREKWSKVCIPFVMTALFLWVALGCYESFMVVWLLGICLMLLTQRFVGERKGVIKAGCVAAVIAVAGLALRSVMIACVTEMFGLEYLKDEAVQRSITEMAGWLFEPGALGTFGMILKRVFVMYGVFAYAYYPIRIFVLAAVVIVCFGIWRTIRQRDIWIFILTIGSFIVSFLLVVIEGKSTLYRSAQFLPIICGYGALLSVYAVSGLGRRSAQKSKKAVETKAKYKKIVDKFPKCCYGLLIFVLSVILWNQCVDMNKWFYVDYVKYENAKEYTNQIAYELEKNFDTSKPVVFTGIYGIPQSLIADAYVGYGTETFFQMKRITDWVDETLLEKFYRTDGVWVAQTPTLSVISWGKYAFDDDSELVRFFEMHGHELVPQLDTSVYESAEQYALSLPHFPEEGSIVDMGDYIIVNF